jgi:UDP-glucose-4-epimerase GalE
MKILIAGGAGYIGSHTVKELIREGFEVVIFDNFSTGKRILVPEGEIIEGDLFDQAELEKTFRIHDFQGVIHLASLIQVGESYLDPQKYFRHNLITSLNLLQAMLQAKVKNFIFSSSAAVYGVPEQVPISESHKCNPSNPYGLTKYFVEKILQQYGRAYGLKFISLRYFNAAGADPEGQLGEMHQPETHLIPSLLLSLLGEKKRFSLFGSDFSTPDGTAIRDYIHVKDLAKAHVLALKKLPSISHGEYINLGTNKGYSVLDVIKRVESVTGQKVSLTIKPRRKGDVAILLASKEKAERLLGWKLEYSSLDTIVRTAWAWHQKTYEARI